METGKLVDRFHTEFMFFSYSTSAKIRNSSWFSFQVAACSWTRIFVPCWTQVMVFAHAGQLVDLPVKFLFHRGLSSVRQRFSPFYHATVDVGGKAWSFDAWFFVLGEIDSVYQLLHVKHNWVNFECEVWCFRQSETLIPLIPETFFAYKRLHYSSGFCSSRNLFALLGCLSYLFWLVNPPMC